MLIGDRFKRKLDESHDQCLDSREYDSKLAVIHGAGAAIHGAEAAIHGAGAAHQRSYDTAQCLSTDIKVITVKIGIFFGN